MKEERPVIRRSFLECKLHGDKNKFRNARRWLIQWETLRQLTLTCVHTELILQPSFFCSLKGEDLELRDFYLSAAPRAILQRAGIYIHTYNASCFDGVYNLSREYSGGSFRTRNVFIVRANDRQTVFA